MARVPHGYHDTELIARDLRLHASAGVPTVTAESRADSARVVAVAYSGARQCA